MVSDSLARSNCPAVLFRDFNGSLAVAPVGVEGRRRMKVAGKDYEDRRASQKGTKRQTELRGVKSW